MGAISFLKKLNETVPFTGYIVEYYYGTTIPNWVQKVKSGKTVEIKYFYENGNKQSSSECGYKGELGNGVYLEWYKDGNLKIEGHYVKGKKNGLWTYYYSNGNKSNRGKYSKDKKKGKWEHWSEKGE